jgi:hypothetical protein
MKWLIVAVVILALGLVGGIFYSVGRSATSVQPTPTQQATPAPTQNPPTVTPPPQGTPKPTQPPVVAAPKLLDNISVFEAAYGHPQYMQYLSGKQYYDTAYQFTYNGKNIYVFALHDKVTAVGMKVADSTLDDLKPYLPKDAGKPYDGGNGIQVYPMTSGEIGLGVSEGYNILLFKPYEQ